VLRRGDAMPVRECGPVARGDIVRFAGAGGDFNPLHYDDEHARAAGFDGVIAMGQYQAGLLAAALSDWVGAEHVTSFRVRFARPVSVGDVVLLQGTVTAVESGHASVELNASVGESVVLTGSATVRTTAPADEPANLSAAKGQVE
jgi:acyl dehydratase